MNGLSSAALIPMCGHEVLAWEYHETTKYFQPVMKKGSNIIRLQTKLHRKSNPCFLGAYLWVLWKSPRARAIANGRRQKALLF